MTSSLSVEEEEEEEVEKLEQLLVVKDIELSNLPKIGDKMKRLPNPKVVFLFSLPGSEERFDSMQMTGRKQKRSKVKFKDKLAFLFDSRNITKIRFQIEVWHVTTLLSGLSEDRRIGNAVVLDLELDTLKAGSEKKLSFKRELGTQNDKKEDTTVTFTIEWVGDVNTYGAIHGILRKGEGMKKKVEKLRRSELDPIVLKELGLLHDDDEDEDESEEAEGEEEEDDEEKEEGEEVKIAHISDNHIHVGTFTEEEYSVLPKRNQFFIKHFKTKKAFDNDVYKEALEDIAREKVDHIVHTGDIGVMSVDREFELARKELTEHYLSKVDGFPDEKKISELFSVSPGNHDYYRIGTMGEETNYFMNHFGDTLPENEDSFPYLKVIKGYILIMVFSTRHEGVLDNPANGSVLPKDMEKAERILDEFLSEKEEEERTKYFRILAIHHNPIKRYKYELFENIGGIKKEERLPLQEFIKKRKFSMVCCGHTHNWQNCFSQEETGSTLIVDSGSVDYVGVLSKSYPGFIVFTFKKGKGLTKFVRKTWDFEKKAFVPKELKLSMKQQKFV